MGQSPREYEAACSGSSDRYYAGVDHPAQQYYNPNLTEAEERTLLRRNYLLLMAVQAALGLIGPGNKPAGDFSDITA